MPNTWVAKAPLPVARGWIAATALNGKLYTLGGRVYPGQNGDTMYDNLEVYDPTTNSWTELYRFPFLVHGSSLVGINNLLYAFGGYYQAHKRGVRRAGLRLRSGDKRRRLERGGVDAATTGRSRCCYRR